MAGLLGVDGIFVDVDAWVDDDLEYVVAGVEVHAWGVHASVDAHTSDAADGDVEVVVTVHLYRRALDDAYDAGWAEKLEVVDPNWGHGDSQASFHSEVQLHCSRSKEEISFLFHVDRADLFDHHSEVSDQSLAGNRFLSNFDYLHSANALVPSLAVVLVMPLFF